MNLDGIKIVDHHAHTLTGQHHIPADDFISRFTESSDPEIRKFHAAESLYFKSSLHMIAQYLKCNDNLEAVLKKRNSIDYRTYVGELLSDAGIETVFCDYGYKVKEGFDHNQLTSILPCMVSPVLRIESLAEELLPETNSLDEFIEAFKKRLDDAPKSGFIALKSIIAYRTGYKVEKHSTAAIEESYRHVRKVHSEKSIRLCSKPLNDHILQLALESASITGLPLQLHAGYGDNDIDLRLSNPLDLREIINRCGCRIVLLHAAWPFTREASYLSAVHGNVWIDLSLAVPHMTSGIGNMLSEILGIAPHSKILFGSDASYLPESYWLAAKWIRIELGSLLDSLISRKLINSREADSIANAILRDNALKLYSR